MRHAWLLFTVPLLVMLVMAADTLGDDRPAPQKKTKLKRQIGVELDYLLYLPEKYEEKEAWPMILFLHGAGERGDNLELVKIHGPPKLIEQGKQLPFIVVSPQCPKELWWEPLALGALVDEVVEKHKVDENRIYVTGLSMGGFGTWSLAARFPDRFAAIAPICGGGEKFRVKRHPHLPTWVFHGAKDGAVPIARSQEMVDALKKWKSPVQFTIYPEAEHDSWTETYENPKLYEWFLQQSLAHLKSKKRNSDERVRAVGQDGATVVWISSSHGMGRTVIEREMAWPENIVIRARLRGLESFAISNGSEKLEISVPSDGSDNRLVRLWRDGKEGPRLDESSKYWTDVQIVSTRGRARIPLRDGYFELKLPAALLKENPESVKLEWIDFYRR